MIKKIIFIICLTSFSIHSYGKEFDLKTYLNAKKIDYQGLATKLENIGYSNMNKTHGNMLEAVSDARFTGKGRYGKRIGEVGSNGIDGLYSKNHSSGYTKEILITESKFGKDNNLRITKNGDLQMSKNWILLKHDELIASTEKKFKSNKISEKMYNKLIREYKESKYFVQNDVYKAKILKGDFIDGKLKVKIESLKGVETTIESFDIPFSKLEAVKLDENTNKIREKVLDSLKKDYEVKLGKENSDKMMRYLKEGKIKNKADLLDFEHQLSNDYLRKIEVKRIRQEKGLFTSIKANVRIKEQFKVNQFYRDFEILIKKHVDIKKSEEILSSFKKSNHNSILGARIQADEIIKSNINKSTIKKLSGKTIKGIRRARVLKKVLRIAGVAGIAVSIGMDVYDVGKLIFDYKKGLGNSSILMKSLIRLGVSTAFGTALGAALSVFGPVGTFVGFLAGYTIGGFLVDTIIDIPQTKYKIVKSEESINKYIDSISFYCKSI
ncbi:MAG: hypothetical protein OCD02_03130 [Spirochaetaceae bacterium]